MKKPIRKKISKTSILKNTTIESDDVSIDDKAKLEGVFIKATKVIIKANVVLTNCKLFSDGIVYIGASYTNRIIALDAYTGKELWEYATEYKVISSPAVGGSLVFIGSTDANVYAFDTKTGTLVWKYNTAGGISGSSATVSGGTVYIGAEDKKMYAFEKSSGKLIWSFKADESISSTPLVSNGFLYMTSADNTVYAFSDEGTARSTNLLSREANTAGQTIKPVAQQNTDAGVLMLKALLENSQGQVLAIVGGAVVVVMIVWARRRYHA